MIQGKRIVVAMPAYNAERTLGRTYDELPHEHIDSVILVDDGSNDRTVAVSRDLGIQAIVHNENRGYGGNQKTCYREALSSINFSRSVTYGFGVLATALAYRLQKSGFVNFPMFQR